MPDRPWVMTQTWHDLLFAHWPVETRQLRERVPQEFALDLFDNTAWLGVVPFHMTNVGLRAMPPLPWLSAFPELNVRTYVRVGNRPGIYFFSLDAGSVLAVKAARTLLNLPYYAATMRVTSTANAIEYDSRRDTDDAAALVAAYEPIGPVFRARAGSLEHFLTERYCLYHRDHGGAPYRLDIHHLPWPLQDARARLERNTMADAGGVTLPDQPPLLHFAKRVDMVAWLPTKLDLTKAGRIV